MEGQRMTGAEIDMNIKMGLCAAVFPDFGFLMHRQTTTEASSLLRHAVLSP